MKTLNKLLSESFNNPYDYKKVNIGFGFDVLSYEFKTKNDTIIVRFDKFKKAYEKGKKVKKSGPPRSPMVYNVSFGSKYKSLDDVDDKTNKGDAFRVFATLIKIVQEVYKKDVIAGIAIGIKEANGGFYNPKAREFIYSRLIKKFSSGQVVDKRTMKKYTIIHKKKYDLFDPVDRFMRDTQPVLRF